MTLNEMVKLCRLRSMLTIAEAAVDSGYSRSAIYKIEEGQRKVPLSYIAYWVGRGLFDINDVTKYENTNKGVKS